MLIADFHGGLEDRIDARRLTCFAIGLLHQMYFGTKLKVALAWLSGEATKDGRKALGQELGLSADRIRRIEDEVRCSLLDELKYQIFDAV
ncbi:hypothetical protein [Rhodobacteraceae bacterium DSL-40]|uniref:hypothetical protein n=1 Tax=Amaricoccus sp. B4 TaxID=3368557 RepID=UPI000DADBDE1